MSDIILTVDNFSLNIKNRAVLQNVTFNVERGDYLAIGGIPGSGKSSLIKSMLGLITTGIEGEIAYHNIGKDEVSYIPQNVMQTKEEFPGTAREIVAIGMISRNRGKIMGESDWEKVDELLKDMGLFEVRDKKINKLNTLQQLKAGDQLLIIVGCEGGFDESEIQELNEMGVKCCSLGNRILRSETAPLYLMSVIGYSRELIK